MPTTPDIAQARETTVARALVNRTEISAAAAATKEGKLSAKVLAAREKQRQEAIGSRGTLNAWRTESPVDIPDAAKAEKLITDHVDVGKQGIARNTDQALRELFTGNRAALKNNIELTPDAFIGPLKKVMSEIPEFNAIAQEIDANPAASAEWAKFVMDQMDAGRAPGDNRFIDKLREKYAAFIDKDRAEVLSPTAARRELAGLKNTHGAKNTEFSENNSSIDETQAKIASYNDITTPGALGKKLIDQRAAVKDDVRVVQYETQQGELANLEAQVTDRKDARSSTTNAIRHREIDGEIKTLNGQIAAKKTEMTPYEQEVQKLNNMEAEKAGLPTSLTQLYDRAKVLETEIDGIAERITAAEAALSNATGGKKEDVGAQLQGLVGEAFKETMIARDAAERQGIIDTFDAQIKTETDPDVRAGLKVLKTRYTDWEDKRDWKNWKKGFGLGHKEVLEVNKKSIDKDLKVLLAGGPKDLVAGILSGQINPNTIDAANPFGMMYSPDQIAELVKNEEFMKKIGPQSVGILLRQATHEGMMSERMISQMQDQEWWAEGFDALIKPDERVVAEVEKHVKGVDRVGWLKDKKNLGILALLLLLTGGGVGLPIAFAAYKTVTAGKGQS